MTRRREPPISLEEGRARNREHWGSLTLVLDPWRGEFYRTQCEAPCFLAYKPIEPRPVASQLDLSPTNIEMPTLEAVGLPLQRFRIPRLRQFGIAPESWTSPYAWVEIPIYMSDEGAPVMVEWLDLLVLVMRLADFIYSHARCFVLYPALRR